jgi:SAM-dependent methyltransferase
LWCAGVDIVRREASNRIRFVIEDLLPPIVKDSALFRFAARAAFGDYVDAAADFRRRAPFLTEDEYVEFYRNSPQAHGETDNSEACLARIAADVVGSSLCDVGCGTGHLLRYVRAARPDALSRLAGVEIAMRAGPDPDGIEFHSGRIERLPFASREFDTVVCTHVVEHILDHRGAIAELRRITARRLIVVVPMERESLYSFNPHFHFFPYPHSFLRAMIPVPRAHVCEAIGRDIYYREDATH